MVRSLKPPGVPRRGSGSGRAGTPEAEAARREKIARAVRARSKRIHVLIQSDYRNKGRTHTRTGEPVGPGLKDWAYREARVYSTYIRSRDTTDGAALQAHLNKLHPSRVHYRAVVVEYLPGAGVSEQRKR